MDEQIQGTFFSGNQSESILLFLDSMFDEAPSRALILETPLYYALKISELYKFVSNNKTLLNRPDTEIQRQADSLVGRRRSMVRKEELRDKVAKIQDRYSEFKDSVKYDGSSTQEGLFLNERGGVDWPSRWMAEATAIYVVHNGGDGISFGRNATCPEMPTGTFCKAVDILMNEFRKFRNWDSPSKWVWKTFDKELMFCKLEDGDFEK